MTNSLSQTPAVAWLLERIILPSFIFLPEGQNEHDFGDIQYYIRHWDPRQHLTHFSGRVMELLWHTSISWRQNHNLWTWQFWKAPHYRLFQRGPGNSNNPFNYGLKNLPCISAHETLRVHIQQFLQSTCQPQSSTHQAWPLHSELGYRVHFTNMKATQGVSVD